MRLLEQRSGVGKVMARQTRAGASGQLALVGLAAPYDSWSVDLGDFREKIVRGAFARTLTTSADVAGLYNHDVGNVLARRSSGTLRLWDESDGLHFEMVLDYDYLSNFVSKRVKRNDLAAMSFGFRVMSDVFSGTYPDIQRRLLDVELHEISVVCFPAYPQTHVRLGQLQRSAPRSAPLPAAIATKLAGYRERAKQVCRSS